MNTLEPFRFTHWPTEHWATITQPFGANPNYYSQFGPPKNRLKGHEGIDLRAPKGSRIFAAAPGIVSDVNHLGVTRSGKPHNYGIFVRITHSHGYETTYAHLQAAAVVVGQGVVGGHFIGTADNTGNIRSGASHLHLTLKKFPRGDPNWPYNIVDPTPFITELIRRGPEKLPRQSLPVAVVGKLADVRPYKGQPGYLTFADKPGWTLAANLAWLDSIILRNYPILLVSNPRQATGIYKVELRHILGNLPGNDDEEPKGRRPPTGNLVPI